MNKWSIVLILILFVLLIGGGLWWWLTQTTDNNPPPAPTDPSQVFPVPPRVTTPPTVPAPTGSDNSALTISQPNPGLISLSERAVAGAMVTSSSSVLFLERETGLVVEMNLANRERKEIARAAIVPAIGGPIREAILALQPAKFSVWFSAGGAVKNYFRGQLAAASTSDNFSLPEIELELIEGKINTLIISPAADQIFTLEQVGEETIGKVLNLKTNRSRLVFESKINAWLVAWPEKNLISLTTKPTNQGAGAAYLLNLRNDKLERIIGGINGLLTLISPDGQKILYSRGGASGLELGLYDRQKNTNRILTISTLPEKCVWSQDSSVVYCASPRILPPAVYPDDWLAGEIIFDDWLWEINAATGLNRLIWSAETGLGDAIKLQIADQGKVVFTDRLTDRLYLIDSTVNEVGGSTP